MPPLSPEQSLYFRDEFRRARAAAVRDAEAWHAVVVGVERLVAVVAPGKTLNQAAAHVCAVAAPSPLATEIPAAFRAAHTPFDVLYHLVRNARNAALHEGAFARRLTRHAIELCLVLEHALTPMSDRVSDYMVRDPVIAELWQPVSFVRQTMLVNSFSYLPVAPSAEETEWRLVSDLAVARYIRGDGSTGQAARLATPLAQAIATGGLTRHEAHVCRPDASITAVVRDVSSERPVLVVAADGTRLLGILTPFDLL